MSPSRRAALAALVVLASASAGASAAPGPLPGGYVTDGTVYATATDDQGRLYAGGDFTMVGPATGNLVAATTTSSTLLGGGLEVDGSVQAMVPDGSGGMYIGGDFTAVDGVARSRLAHLNADRSLDLGWNPGADQTVRALATDGTSVFAGGDFTHAGGVGRQRLAKIGANGAVDPTWNPGAFGTVYALTLIGPNLYVGSDNLIANTNPLLARVSTAGAGAGDATFVPTFDGPVRTLLASGTTLYAGGDFAHAGGAAHAGLAKLDTTVAPGNPVDPTWEPAVSPMFFNTVRALALDGANLVVGGQFSAVNGTGRSNLAKVSTSGVGALDAWDPTALGAVSALAVSGDDLIVGGQFGRIAGQLHNYVGKVSLAGGTADASWDPHLDGAVNALALSGSSLFIGGDFGAAGPQVVARSGIVRFNGDAIDASWHLEGSTGVRALLLDGDQLYVGGNFQTFGNRSRHGLAKVSTGTTAVVDPLWGPFVGFPGVETMAMAGGSLFVGGQFPAIGATSRPNLAKLSPTGTGDVDPDWNPAPNGEVAALAVDGNALFVGGEFTSFATESASRSRIAKLSTTGTGLLDPTWNPGAGAGTPPSVHALIVSGPDLYVGGTFITIAGVTRRRIAKLSTTGTGAADPTWDPNAGSDVLTLLLDGTDLYAGGYFTTIGGQSRTGVARLSTTGTGAADPTFAPPAVEGGPVLTLAATPSRLIAGGFFTGIGGHAFQNLAFYDLTRPTVAITVPADGGRYGQQQTVAASFGCDDPDGAANVASCIGTIADGASLDTATAGPRSFTLTATDGGGNTATKTVSYVIDGSAPTVAVSGPEAGVTYTQGQSVSAGYACDDVDGPSDVATCAGPVANGAGIDTASPGLHTFSVTTADVAGNRHTERVTYLVSAAGGPGTAGDTTPPALAGWRIAPAAFRAAGSGASAAAARHPPVGAKVSYTLSEAATLRITVLQPRKHGRALTIGGFTVRGAKGAGHFHFTGRVNGGRLAPGSYRLSVRAIDAARNSSKAAVASFRIVR